MTLAGLVLIFSIGVLVVCLQVSCWKILRHSFDQDYFRTVVDEHQLTFVTVRQMVQQSYSPGNCLRFRSMLKNDFLTLRTLLKNSATFSRRYWTEEGLLTLYSRFLFFSLFCYHLFRLPQRRRLLKLTAVLEYLANVVRVRMREVAITNQAFSDFLLGA